jgi:hypothetical protein
MNCTRDLWDIGRLGGVKWGDALTTGGNSRIDMVICGYWATAWYANAPVPPIE